VAFFPQVGPKEAYRTACYDTLAFQLVAQLSYRKAEAFLNRFRWQDAEDTVRSRSLAAAVVREGAKIINYINKRTQQILTQNHLDPQTGAPEADHLPVNIEGKEIPSISAAKVALTINEYNASREEERQIDARQIEELFEDPSVCVNISVDDVGVIEQKASGRSKNSPPKETRHYVRNTVIHIQQGAGKYILDGLGIRKTLLILLAFLCHNDLQDRLLVFFTDGADDIKNAIQEIYSLKSFKIILDWYHLTKKGKERLSMGLKGRQVRNEVLKELLALLWLGKVDAAIKYLAHLDDGKVRNPSEIAKLIAYLERNRDYIPCYALRKRLGLRVSSNRGEKANDLVVAQRQKHNGMSWSRPGSSGLANIQTLFLNQEDANWITERELNFKLVYPSPPRERHRPFSGPLPAKKCA
jgi:hypothetical protein